MRLISKSTLREYWIENPDAEGELRKWCYVIEHAKWQKPTEVKEKYGNASIVTHDRIVFNICGNNYRIVAQVKFKAQTVIIRFVGTHKEYDKVDAREI